MQWLPHPSREFDRLARALRPTPPAVERAVTGILRAVRERGDDALVALTRRFDGVSLKRSAMRVSPSVLRRAGVSPGLARAARGTLREVRAFALASLPRDWTRRNAHGASVGEKFDPLGRVGVYIPGGSVPLMSTVYMTVALARVAGVREIAVCTPPPIAAPLLWALGECDATEVYQIGGAQAIAAMAYGTGTISAVDKIFGPGNSYVTEAKRQLFGVVAVDLLAGPSELMVLADESARMDWAAADLLAQAEHGSGYERIFCVSPSRTVLRAIHDELHRQAGRYISNRSLARVLSEGTWWIQTRTRKGMVEVANALAPEHLQIMTQQARQVASKIRAAGAIFLGNHSPTVLGDFVAGPSHTLPTGGAGRAISGLRVADFMRRTSMVEYPSVSLGRAAAGVAVFAEAENLPAHAASMQIRAPAAGDADGVD